MVQWRGYEVTLTGGAVLDPVTDTIIMQGFPGRVVFEDINPLDHGFVVMACSGDWSGGIGYTHPGGYTRCRTAGGCFQCGATWNWDGLARTATIFMFTSGCDPGAFTNPKFTIDAETAFHNIAINSISVQCNPGFDCAICESCNGYPNYTCDPMPTCPDGKPCDPVTGCVRESSLLPYLIAGGVVGASFLFFLFGRKRKKEDK